ncbi:MAG TPA: chorismate-binding protein, partial [Chitinophagaceae bacterium]|nr:chorismate-binding protein [Chitinophagaceae bacterium]
KWNTDLKNKEVLFYNLNQSNPCPFATFMRKDNTYIFSTSPERFFTIDYPYIHSQPIKGTIKRGKNAQEDVIKMQKLKNDPKELNENHIIANMVINEFQTLDCCSSVTLIEDAVLYSFPKLHHLISTIRGEYNTYKEIETLAFNAFAALFPMGSMTGTPKNHVLNIIHDIEDSERGYYSGTIGYIDPDNKIDSNVIIRTLIYDDERKLASFHVGGAITLETNAKREWKEIILKSEFLK